MPRTLEEYLSLPYTIVLRKDARDLLFVARVAELQGCSAHGSTEQEALSNLHDNMEDWIRDSLDAGDPIPEPATEIDLPSGKWLQRVPRSLHLKLVNLAKTEGVSLNQLVTTALAETVGLRTVKLEVSHSFAVGPTWVYTNLLGAPCPITDVRYDIKNEIGLGCQLSLASEAYMTQLSADLLPHVQAGGMIHLDTLQGAADSERRTYGESKKQILAYQS